MTLILTLISCARNDCAPPTTGDTRIKKIVKDYFPYHAGEKIKFMRYIDTAKVGEIELTIDTSSSVGTRETMEWCSGGMGQEFRYENLEHFKYTFVNQTEAGKNWTLELTAEYGSELLISMYGSDFSFDYFENAIVNGNPFFAVDSIFLNNKNYGPGFCTDLKASTRIYFNSTYGILKYINYPKKEQLIYTE